MSARRIVRGKDYQGWAFKVHGGGFQGWTFYYGDTRPMNPSDVPSGEFVRVKFVEVRPARRGRKEKASR